MKIRSNTKIIAASWISLILIVLITIGIFLFRLEPLITDFAISNAKSDLLNTANKSVISVLENSNVTYDNLSHINRDKNNKITGIEVDTKNINLLKSKISVLIDKEILKKESYIVKIPLGTLISNEYFGGFGPKIKFYSQLSNGCRVDFKSSFTSTGINQTRHRIIINITLSGVILILNRHRSFSVSTSYIAAETIIVGAVPETYASLADGKK